MQHLELRDHDHERGICVAVIAAWTPREPSEWMLGSAAGCTLGYTLRQEGLEVFAAEDGERGSKPSGSAVRMSSCWT
jgi:hypothetical protein